MTDYTKQIREKLDIITLTKENFDQIIKDRLDFGFDSIYFRYSEICDELAIYKAKVNRTDPEREYKDIQHRKMHFYEALEQLTHAHEEERKKYESYRKSM